MPLVKRQPAAVTIQQEERQSLRDCASLGKQLEHPDAVARRWAARDLAACPQAVPCLLARLNVESDASVREIIFSSLILLNGEDALHGLIVLLKSDHSDLRNGAIDALKQLPDAVAPFIERLLADPAADTRIFAINILESLSHAEMESWLIHVIQTDQHVNVCATALEVLSEVGTRAAHAPILQVKQRFSSEPYIQFAAELALKRIAQG